MQGVQRVFDVLETVAYHQPVGVGEVARLVSLPKSTVQRHLWALAKVGWLRPVGENEFTRWTLTSRALMIGQRGSREGQLRDVAFPLMRDLRDASGETVTLQIPASISDMVQIERVDSERPVRTFGLLGEITPAYANAGGIAYLSALDDETATLAIPSEFRSMTVHTPTSAQAVRELIAETRQRRYAVNIGMNRDGVCAVAAAVLDRDRRHPLAALAISVPDIRFNSKIQTVLGDQVVRAAEQITSGL